jgi:hypothetical protein
MFKKKAAIYCFFAFVANVFTQIGYLYAPQNKNTPAEPIYYILSLLGFIASFIPTGYLMSCIKAVREQETNIVLPFLNIKSNFILGFKCMIGIIFMSLVFGFTYVIFLIIPAIIFALIGSKVLFAIFVVLMSLILILLISIYSPALSCIFAEKEWITSFFRYIRATKLIAQYKGNYFKYAGIFVLLIILLTVLNAVIQTLLYFGIFGAVLAALIISLIGSYTVFVFVYLAAKSVVVRPIE